jgi:hypothetical protein
VAEKRAERLQVMLTMEEVRRVEEWRFDNRMPSRSAAVRSLMNIGLQTDAVVDESGLLEGAVHSGDVGVVDNSTVHAPQSDGEANGPPVLVVESDFLVGHGIMSVLQQAGLSVIGPEAGYDEASARIENESPAAAVIGLRPDDADVEAFAARLADKDIPFLFCTAADPKTFLPEHLWSIPVVSRISAGECLADTVSALVSGGMPEQSAKTA